MTAHEQLYVSDRAPELLLHASICVGRRRHYSVVLTPGSRAPIEEHDLFRFALYYYAFVLHALSARHHSVRDLPRAVDRYATGAPRRSTDVFALAGVRAEVRAALTERTAETSVHFRRLGYRDFDVIGDPLAGSGLACSVLAVLQTVVQRVSPEVDHAIRTALANMNVSYMVTHRYSDPLSCHEVPALAYAAAAFL